MISIDVRFINNSGIGRYIKSIVPLLPKYLNVKINLLKNHGTHLNDSLHGENFCNTNIYSSYYTLFEQVEIPLKLVHNSTLLWTPHYNFPCLRGGINVVTVHDLAHLALQDRLGSPLKNFYARTMFKMLSKKVDKVICVSNFTRNELIKYTDINPDKIEVIYNGLEDYWFNIKKEKAPEPSPFLLYVGNIKPHKNLKTLVKSFLQVIEKIPHNLILVGKREGFITGDSEINDLVNEAPERIKFTGYISDKKLQQYYAYAAAMIFPSSYEGFGYPPLEAMACGTPVIASNTASMPEICEDAAYYFEPHDIDELSFKIENLLLDNELTENFISKGYRQAKKYTIEECVQKTARVISCYS